MFGLTFSPFVQTVGSTRMLLVSTMFVSQYRSELIINVAVEGTFDLGTILNTS